MPACSCGDDAPKCGDGERFAEGSCVPIMPPKVTVPPLILDGPCTPGEMFCDGDVAATCAADGMSAPAKLCPAPKICAAGACVDRCTAGEVVGCDGMLSRSICGADGHSRTSSACPSETLRCVAGECLATTLCTPSGRDCDGDDVLSCSADGFAQTRFHCPLGCALGACHAPCFDELDDNVGCQFFVARLDNAYHPDPFAITVSNTSTTEARVLIHDSTGRDVRSPLRVAPGTLATIELPSAKSIPESSLSRDALEVISDQPVTVHQFNPRNDVGAYSNDASLIMPANAGGEDFVAMSWLAPGRMLNPDGSLGIHVHSYVTLIATQDSTLVEVTPLDVTVEAMRVPEIQPGETARFSLSRGEVLSIAADDMTGTRIHASHKIVAFGGHTCANVPAPYNSCDHLEEQLLPMRSWGNVAVVGKFQPRGAEPDIIRVLAAQADTDLTTDPPVMGLDGRRLQPGEIAEARVDHDVVITASGPISVGQFMVGWAYECAQDPMGCTAPRRDQCGRTDTGDPSMLIVTPTSLWRANYLVLVPDDYSENYLTITAPIGARVEVEGSRVTLAAIGDGAFAGARVPVREGLVRVTADQPIALYVYGYDCAVSYAYPGGFSQ